MAVDYGRYQLLKKIASGGMGQVFLARTAGTQGFDKLVVLKRILPQLVEDDEFIEMFLDEARIAARLNHPNLVQIFELEKAEGTLYLAMEYVAGEDLRRLDKRARAFDTPVPVPLVLRIIADASAGLDYAHKARDAQGKPLCLIHRDVSPQNVLVGFDGSVKMIDFGVAKAAGRIQQTATGILKGKYPYMSPEQADGLEMDGRSDQFALGIVAWELLTGRRLFKGDSDLQTLRLVKECQVPPPSRFNPSVPAALDELLLKMLARDFKARFTDLAEVRLAIEDFLIAHAMAASSAHLSAFMQKLYSDRIEREADPSQLDELPANASIEPGSTPATRQSGTIPRWDLAPTGSTTDATVASRGDAAPPQSEAGVAVVVPSQRTQTQALPSEPKLRGKLFAAVGGAVTLVAVGIALPFILGKSPEQQEIKPLVVVESEVIVPVVAEAVKPAPPPPVPDILVDLVTIPAGAQVAVGGVSIGVTPLKLSMPIDGSVLVAAMSLEGYEPAEQQLSKASGPTVTHELKKKKAVKVTVKKPPPPGIKTGR